MDHSKIIKQLNKCKNDKLLYKLLYKIRTQHIDSRQNLEKFSLLGTGKLSEILASKGEDEVGQDREKIVEILLSILGNCTYNNEKAVLLAFDNKIVETIISILNKTESSLIKTKACRLIGNLSSYEKVALSLQHSGAAFALSNCMTDDASPLLQSMVIRGLRVLWSSKKFRTQILSFGTIGKVMQCLHKILKDSNANTGQEHASDSNNIVILKRQNEPDRQVTKEKLSEIIKKMEIDSVETSYEIVKPKREEINEFLLPSAKESKDLVFGILKFLLTITSSSLPHIVVRSIFADAPAVTYSFYIIIESNTYRCQALKILSNLSFSLLAQEFMHKSTQYCLISSISNLLLNKSNLDHPMEANEQKYCIEILCLSSENACNRLKLKRSGVFREMLSIAETTSNQEMLNFLIFFLFQYRFDEQGLQALIQMNLVNILIKILKDLLSVMAVDHAIAEEKVKDEESRENERSEDVADFEKDLEDQKPPSSDPEPQSTSKKRSIFDEDDAEADESPPSQLYKRTNSDNTEDRRNLHPKKRCTTEVYPINWNTRFSASPPQYSFQTMSSPSTSSGYSPFNSPTLCYHDYDSDSNQYSPVCSDNEEESGVQKTQEFDILSFIYNNEQVGQNVTESEVEEIDLDDNTTEVSNTAKKCENYPETLKQITSDQLQYVILLLWTVSLKNSSDQAFVKGSNIKTLLKACSMVKQPNGKIYQILQHILEQTRNFVAIFMKQTDLVFDIYALSSCYPAHGNCDSCTKLKAVSLQLLKDLGKNAESGYGQGEIAHCFMTGCGEMKKKISIATLYIISSPEILNRLLFKFNTLHTIFEIILDESDMDSSEKACSGITMLAKNLRIQIPCDDDVLQKIIPDDFTLIEYEMTDVVKFICKDGEVNIDKSVLTQSSDVFQSMFCGSFRESCSNEVNFVNYSVESMRYFHQILKMSEDGKLKVIAPKIENILAVLEAYELSILYILTDIQNPLLNLIKILLNEESVLRIYEWSMRNLNHDLVDTSICYFLCGDVSGDVKRKLYLEASRSQFSNEWRSMIVDCISMSLSEESVRDSLLKPYRSLLKK